MAYVPIDRRDLTPPVAGDGTFWQTLIDNDAEAFEQHNPGYEANPHGDAYTAAQEFHLRLRGNADESPIVVGIRAVASSGTKTFTAETTNLGGDDSDTVGVTTDAWYTITLAGTGYPDPALVDIKVSLPSPSPQTVAVTGLRLRRSLSAPAAGTLYASGYRLVGTRWYATGAGINTDVLSLLRTNPINLAIERPDCVFAHVAEVLRSVTAKSPDLWGAYDSDQWARVGAGFLPRCDLGEGTYTFDAYTTETGTDGTAQFLVQVGPVVEEWTAGSGDGWHSWTATLGPGPHEIVASLIPGVGEGAAIRSFLAWRHG